MNRKSRKSSRLRMSSRKRGRREGPSVVYDLQMPPHAYTCNRAAKRGFTKSGIDHTKVPMNPLRKAGCDQDGKPVYLMGDQRFIPPYLWRRVKPEKKGRATS